MHFFYNVIAPDYFRALRIGLIAGRDFSRDDDETAQPVTIVNETMARDSGATRPARSGSAFG